MRYGFGALMGALTILGAKEKLIMAPIFFYIIAFLCTAGATGLAIWHIYMHLVNYTEPTYQRHIVRIIFMVPVSTSPCKT